MFSFGSGSAATGTTTPLATVKPPAVFAFGAQASTTTGTTSTVSDTATTVTASSMFSFGSSSTTTPLKTDEQKPQTLSSTLVTPAASFVGDKKEGFSFGDATKKAGEEKASLFNFGSASKPAMTFSFGTANEKKDTSAAVPAPGSTFGFAAKQPAEEAKPVSSFSFFSLG